MLSAKVARFEQPPQLLAKDPALIAQVALSALGSKVTLNQREVTMRLFIFRSRPFYKFLPDL